MRVFVCEDSKGVEVQCVANVVRFSPKSHKGCRLECTMAQTYSSQIKHTTPSLAALAVLWEVAAFVFACGRLKLKWQYEKKKKDSNSIPERKLKTCSETGYSGKLLYQTQTLLALQVNELTGICLFYMENRLQITTWDELWATETGCSLLTFNMH